MLSVRSSGTNGRLVLKDILFAPKAAFASIGIITATINILMLTGSILHAPGL